MSERPDSETPFFPDDGPLGQPYEYHCEAETGTAPAPFSGETVAMAECENKATRQEDGSFLCDYHADPNRDLIGYQYVTAPGTPAAETVTVIETVPWSKQSGGQYVTVRFATGHETIKLAGAVRRIRELDVVKKLDELQE